MTKKKPAPKKRKIGRPSRYTPELAAKICARLAEGETLRSVCRDKAMPAISTVMGWLFNGKHEVFSEQYARAREMQADALFDEALEIADDASGDWTEDKDGKKVLDHENIQRSRLRVDTRKWAAGKMAPKKYGDKLDLGGSIGLRWEDALKALE